MRYKDRDIESLIESLEIVDVVGQRVKLKRSGANYQGLCPFHDEKTPSFVVSPQKGIYKCFGCGATGNALKFHMETNHLDFIPAVEDLAKIYDFKLEKEQGVYNKRNEKRTSYHNILKEASNFFEDALFTPLGQLALTYLKERGYKEEFIKKNHLGYSYDSWDMLYKHLLEKGYSETEIESSGLLKIGDKGRYDTFRNRVMFPIYSTDLKVVAFGGRVLSDGDKTAKYLNSPETEYFIKGKNVYGNFDRGRSIREKGYVLLMEGYMDVLKAHSFGFNNAVATLGTACTVDQVKVLKKYSSNIVIAYDMDKAGREAAKKASYILKKYEFNVKILKLENAKDPDEFLEKFGLEPFIKSVRESIDVFEFLFEVNSLKYNIDDILGKKALIGEFKEFFENVTNKIDKSMYMDRLSVYLNLDKEALKEEFLSDNKNIAKRRKKVKQRESLSRRESLEQQTVQIAMKSKKYYKKMEKIEFHTEFLSILMEMLKKEVELSKILQDENFSEFEKKRIVELIFGSEQIDDEELFFEEVMNMWEMVNLQEEETILSKKLSRGNISEEERRKLLYEKFEIIKRIKS